MQRCDFCRRWFPNKQATRAHLKWCAFYLEAKEAGHVQPKQREPAEQTESTQYEFRRCAGCGFEALADDVHGQYARGCPSCGSVWWREV